MSEPPIRVVVADDHAVVREGIRRVLDDDPDVTVVGEASTGAEALAIVEDCRPDVVLLDLGLPDITGFEVVRRLHEAGSPLPRVLVLSMHEDDEYVLRAVRAGVDGYLLKDEAEPAMLRAAVRSVHAGDSYFSTTAATSLAGALRPDDAGREADPLARLTERELEVLQLVATGRSNKEMAAELEISRRTVETHRENLMRKLDIHSIAGLTRLALEQGLLDDGSANPKGTAG